MTRIGGGAGDQDMVNDFVIHLNWLGEGNKKSTKTSLLFASNRSVFSLPPEVFIIRMYAVKAGNILPGKFVRN